MKPEFKTFPAIHPTVCKPCGYCGVMIEGYTKVVRLRQASGPNGFTDPQDILLHPDCLPLFAKWLSEVSARNLTA